MANLDSLPDYFKEKLKVFLENEEQVKILQEQLRKTPIMIDDGKYQLSIDSVQELYAVVERLRLADSVA